ncbi:hypothetical protein [Amycolatopsis albispora]|uniref:Phage tail protein n=1 Tax=Amycolatopsis albispora TaxID=1804986 RepID=A0A344LGY7_9PSEU|nr:hypothetical protein [Amycolatopsis albispora]AXB47311.1 hypothetical protein A4R43_36700 [Amycolatopsis albispora]
MATTFEPGNVLMGPCEVYYGLQGLNTLEPASGAINEAPAASAWDHMGGTLGDVTLLVQPTFTPLTIDQIPDEADQQMTGRVISLAIPLAEVTLKNLARASMGTYSGTPETGENFKLTSGPQAFRQPAVKLLMDGFAPDPSGLFRRRRLVLRKTKNTGGLSLVYGKATQQTLANVFNVFYFKKDIEPLEAWDAPLAA